MDYQQELKDIFASIKNTLRVYQEIGMDPPPVQGALLENVVDRQGKDRGQDLEISGIKDLDQLKAFIGECVRCPLHKGRNHLVFGEGNPNARLVFVGEGPGREEDKIGRPFVGDAGKLLTRIIENGMKLSRNDVYICNIVKCRPPRNRDPEKEEIEACLPFLKQQLAIIHPEVICILGRIAGQALLGKDFKIKRDRGKWYEYMGIPVMPTFHPAYILRNPDAKRPVWDDIKKIMKHLGLKV